MRFPVAGAAAAGLVGLSLLVILAGRHVAREADPSTATTQAAAESYAPPEPSDMELLEQSAPPSQPARPIGQDIVAEPPVKPQELARAEPRAPLSSRGQLARPVPLGPPSQFARPIGQDLVAEPPVKGQDLVRAEPRAPLSPLSQALPPAPKEKNGGLLYLPVAIGSAEFEAMGYKIAIAGTESVGPDETCMHDGVAWACGARAQAAVRAWLRGRALSCKLPPDAGSEVQVVGCRLGQQDVGAWLVSNGWARAVPGGPYVKAEATARQAAMGIFGPPPPALPAEKPAPEALPSDQAMPMEPDSAN
jgi:endonuclease YncB( thermonuclease family)